MHYLSALSRIRGYCLNQRMRINPFFTAALAVTSLVSPCVAQSATQSVSELVSRVTPGKQSQVIFEIKPGMSGFTLSSKENKICVTASNNTDLAAGYGYYLRTVAGVHWSWNGNRLDLPKVLPPLKAEVVVPSPWKWRFAYNYCTLSYTAAFWDKKEWREEVDRLALFGVKQALIQAGLEKVWQLTLTELGYPAEKIKAFIPNPASAAWWNMGNLEGHGGPLTQRQIDQEAELGRFIATEMRRLDMEPVLQGFVGLVPHDLGDYYKEADARYIPQGTWVSSIFVRPAVLDPTTEAFQKVAAIWYKNVAKVYGAPAKAYGGDLFHEGGNSGGINVTEAAKAVQGAMTKASPESTWVIQAWGANPSGALLAGVKKENVVILCLDRNMNDGTNGSNRRGYGGAPWVWCELLNFGGNQALYGGLKILGQMGNLQKSPDKDNLVGLGILSEGVETNPIFYELFFERLWMDKNVVFSPEELQSWLAQYAQNRYGVKSTDVIKALSLLEKSVYSPKREQEGCTESILCARPHRNVQKASTWSSGEMYYDMKDVREAAILFVQAAQKQPELLKSETFRHDLVDVVRQFMSDIARPLLASSMMAFDSGNKAEFNKLSSDYLQLIDATDKLLATYPQWRLGRMYEMALAKAKTPEEKLNMERACRRLLTTWSGQIDSLNDYAHRQMAGLMKDFYYKRWQLFFDHHKKALEGTVSLAEAEKAFRQECHAFELAWEKETKNYTSKPEGDSLKVAELCLKRFTSLSKEVEALAGKLGGQKWSIRNGATTLEFDVSDIITKKGNYKATFQWERGNNALEIHSVALYEGKKLISEDKHEASTGIKNENNTFSLKVPQMRTNLDAYVIKAQVSGRSGNDSEGKFLFLPSK